MVTLGPEKKKPQRQIRAEQVRTAHTCGFSMAIAELFSGATACLEMRDNEERRKSLGSSGPITGAQQAELSPLCRPLPTKEPDKFRASAIYSTPTFLNPALHVRIQQMLMKSTKATVQFRQNQAARVKQMASEACWQPFFLSAFFT